MLAFYSVIWIFFFYFLYVWLYLVHFFYVVLFCIIIIVFCFASQYLYKKHYSIDKKSYEFILYPLCVILCIWIFFFIPTSQTWIYNIQTWDKDIIFVWTNHIGTDKYYSDLSKIIQQYKNQWYTVMYEWIKMTKNTNSRSYKELETIFENTKILTNKYFLDQDIYQKDWISEKDINIDLSSDEIDQLTKWKSLEKIPKYTTLLKIDKKLKVFLGTYLMNPIDAHILSAFHNYWLFLQNSNQSFDTILITARNKHLLDEVIQTDLSKIIIIYWEWHWLDFKKQFKKKLPNIKIENLDFFLPYKL